MADLHIDWKPPILLKKEGEHSLTFDTESIPGSAGVYMFFRRSGKNTTEVVYVGKANNLQKRTSLHMNSHKLISALLDTARGDAISCQAFSNRLAAKSPRRQSSLPSVF